MDLIIEIDNETYTECIGASEVPFNENNCDSAAASGFMMKNRAFVQAHNGN